MITKRKYLLANQRHGEQRSNLFYVASIRTTIRLSLRRTLQQLVLLSAVQVLLQKLTKRYSWTSLTFGEGKRVRLFVMLCSFALVGFTQLATAQLMAKKETFTHADTLRGSLNPNRDWWDVLRYDITVKPDFEKKTIEGIVKIGLKNINKQVNQYLQIDLQQPLEIDSIISKNYQIGKRGEAPYVNYKLKFTRTENTVLVSMIQTYTYQINKEEKKSDINISRDLVGLTIYYHGKPKEAIRPPWDGGWIWRKDAKGNPWMSVACQGLGASAWYPCKDYQGDEPDNGASLTMIVPDTLMAVANGRLMQGKEAERQRGNEASQISNLKSYTWEVKNPINNYLIIPSIGKYVNFTDTLMGEKGKLDLSYWVLDYNLDKAKEQFKQAKLMLRAFEYWFGPYPFYEDSYKLVESPHLGMEHQSATAYGNKFGNGYLGRDLSGSGWGLKWDYIIVHESGHEWFANNITTNDIADMWVHEGFTDYSETLFTEYYYGKEAGNEYNYGQRKGIQNDQPIIGPYGVNKEGSGDMYPKGANLIHTIRHAINNDSLFRQILRGLNKDFYHKTVTTQQVENYISQKSGINFSKTFDQYLRSTQIPKLVYYIDETTSSISYQWTDCIDGFDMPITIMSSNKRLQTATKLKTVKLTAEEVAWFNNKLEKLYYIKTQQLTSKP